MYQVLPFGMEDDPKMVFYHGYRLARIRDHMGSAHICVMTWHLPCVQTHTDTHETMGGAAFRMS
jgi:hypothetical protein